MFLFHKIMYLMKYSNMREEICFNKNILKYKKKIIKMIRYSIDWNGTFLTESQTLTHNQGM